MSPVRPNPPAPTSVRAPALRGRPPLLTACFLLVPWGTSLVAACSGDNADETVSRSGGQFEEYFANTSAPDAGCPAYADSPECNPSCMRRPAPLETGQAACRLFVTLPEPAPCPSEFGWVDAEARWSREPDATGRVCELSQLDGAALEACRTDLECTGCGAGFCVTEVEALQGSCDALGKVAYPRLVGGAGVAVQGQFRLICATEPAQPEG